MYVSRVGFDGQQGRTGFAESASIWNEMSSEAALPDVQFATKHTYHTCTKKRLKENQNTLLHIDIPWNVTLTYNSPIPRLPLPAYDMPYFRAP